MRRFFALLGVALVVVLVAACGSNHTAEHTGKRTVGHAYQTPYGPSAHPPGWGYPPKCPVGRACVAAPPVKATGVKTAIMWDSITLSSIPASPFALAGYTSGWWITFGRMRARWPKAHVVSIAITPTFHADCLDVELGDAAPSQAAAWVRADQRAGFKKPCVYSSYWEFLTEVRPALERAGVKRSEVFEWDADYAGCPRLDVGFDATQCTDHALGRNLDESVVTLPFLEIAQPPYVPPQPHYREIVKLKAAVSRNVARMRRQRCAYLPMWRHVDRARCHLEDQRVIRFNAEIKRLEHA